MTSKFAFTAVLALPLAIFAAPPEGQELIGTHAPTLSLGHWLNSEPLEINALKGKVVLIRWWTDTCPYCAQTAPALRKLQEEFGSEGLQVIGIFHPKPAGDWNMDRVQRAVVRYQFTFPVALDGDWETLKRWWLEGASREFTSVSFILDKQGVIRYVHPGGEYHESDGGGPGHATCDRDFKTIERTIASLLNQP